MAKKAAQKPSATTATTRLAQSFTFRAPAALSVLLVGDFTEWQRKPIPLQPRGEGLWGVEVELTPGVHHYRFLIDGDWRDDPECTVRVPNEFGRENCVRNVG